jgi:5-histidylcysteine sulfoxide synthase
MTMAAAKPSMHQDGSNPQRAPAWAQDKASSLPLLDLRVGREAMLAYFENIWALIETLFSSLASEEAYYIRPYHKSRHPLIFYYVHPVSFYINKLLVAGLIDKPINPHFERLFETGVDEMNWDDLHDGEQDIWPPLSEAVAYREQVYRLVRQVIQSHPALDEAITSDSPGWALVMCFEHERIHLETSSVLMRELPAQHLQQPKSWPQSPQRSAVNGKPQPNHDPVAGVHYPAENPLIAVPEQSVTLGKPRDWPTFGWDNEYGSETRHVPAFRASALLISNGEFYQFVRSGAYLDEKYWSEQGWAWRRFRNTRWPTFWVQDGPAGSHRYRLRSTFEEIDMQWDWPVVVNYYEARAYCAWRSEQDGTPVPYRLLQEKEHLALRDASLSDITHWHPGDDSLLLHDPVMRANTAAGRTLNHNLHFGSEGPVDLFAANSRGFHDVLGNVWQWSEDSFHPLPGFEIHPYYVDFSTPCFDGEHQMILGGSFISTGDEASAWARFHFRPHFFQHAGFRLVLSDEEAVPAGQDTPDNKYEEDAVLNQYMLFHWGAEDAQRDEQISAAIGHPQTQPFMQTMAGLVAKYSERRGAVLDLGCAVGRASFELARDFRGVMGIDNSQRFIQTAERLRQKGALPYQRLESGHFSTPMMAVIDPEIERSRVSFRVGDACQLPAVHRPYDAVLMSNLLCCLPDPAGCLQ